MNQAAKNATTVPQGGHEMPAPAVMVLPERPPMWGVGGRQEGRYGLRYADRFLVNFEVSTRQEAVGVACVAVGGELDMATAEQVIDAVTTAVDTAGITGVRVDLAAVTFLDSAGIGALIRTKRFCDDRETVYRVVNAGGQPRQVLTVTGVLTALTGPAGDALS